MHKAQWIQKYNVDKLCLNEAYTYVKNLTKFFFGLHFEKQDQK